MIVWAILSKVEFVVGWGGGVVGWGGGGGGVLTEYIVNPSFNLD